LAGHTGWVNAVAISPDNRFIVSASDDKTLKIWDAATGAEQATLKGHIRKVNACAVSPDSRFIVSSSGDNTLKIWDASRGQELVTLPLVGDGWCLAFHPWLPFVACGGGGGSLTLIDLIGINFGPIIITPVDHGDGPILRCPACQQGHILHQDQLGNEMTCPTSGCDLKLKINPFIIQMG
jgi:WD40 repeat protein